MRRAIGAVLCRALMQEATARERLLHNFDWGPSAGSRDWLNVVLGKKELNSWWQEIWKKQAAQFSWTKLAYQPTLRWVLECETNTRVSGLKGISSNDQMIFSPDFSTVAHPWFNRWVNQQLLKGEDTKGIEGITNLRKDIQQRRALALDWFSQWELPVTNDAYQTLLLWRCGYQAGSEQEKSYRAQGPVETWFDSIAP